MIQYPICRQQLEQLIEIERPGWIERARNRTNNFSDLGYYHESSSIWSEVKVVYMRLQYGKCAYCERQLESEEYGRIEHDLEHFRPKKKTKSWKLTRALKQAGVVLTAPISGTADPGYHLLAYNLLNSVRRANPATHALKATTFPSKESAHPVVLIQYNSIPKSHFWLIP